MIEHFENKSLDFPPGKFYSYNNSGYFLLGLIIEKVTGKPYENVVKELIFEPLEMTESGFDFLGLSKSIRAQGYQFWDQSKAVPYKHYDSTFAYSAGSIYSTTNDMLKWAQAVSSRQILQPKTWDLAFKAKIRNYGYGWMTGQFSGKKYVRHSGGYPGYMSEFIYYPDEGYTVVLLNNFGNYDNNLWPVGMGISSIVLQLPYDDWKLREEVAVDSNTMKGHTGVYSYGKSKIEIKLKEDGLYALINRELELKLYAEGDNEYFFRDFNTSLSFQDNILSIHEHGEDTQWQKAK